EVFTQRVKIDPKAPYLVKCKIQEWFTSQSTAYVTDKLDHEQRFYACWHQLPSEWWQWLTIDGKAIARIDVSKCYYTAMCMVTDRAPLVNALPDVLNVLDVLIELPRVPWTPT
ncbi:MAG TPA: hypothetical protein VGE27_05975, partial [Gemmatimonas sp.]|uniref:hypothetical protein n=1 Tax=Gemmatimonas sp. TaxID=1962908 RepID=UPI002EDB4A85